MALNKGYFALTLEGFLFIFFKKELLALKHCSQKSYLESMGVLFESTFMFTLSGYLNVWNWGKSGQTVERIGAWR